MRDEEKTKEQLLEELRNLRSRDATERRRSEETSRAGEAQLSNAMKIARLGHWEYDVAEDLFTFNDHFYAIFRTTAERVGGYILPSARYAELFVHPDDRGVVAREVRMAIESPDPNYSRRLEHRILYADGEVGYIAVRFLIVKDGQGRTVKTFGANQDITDRKRAEEERARLETRLLQAQKMETLGTLIGGIAHDFNNILGIIIGNTEMAMEDVPCSCPASFNLKEIKTASLRARDIVGQLLAFGRLSHPKKQIVRLTRIIEDSLKFLRSTIPTTIEIRSSFQAAEDVVMADPAQIQQAMMNLFMNAAQSMESTGGVLSVDVENANLSAGEAEARPELPCGRYVKIVVGDTGAGIDPEIRSRIFDPYFTTKEVGKGSGLGLAVVHGIVENHDGVVRVERNPEKGAAFSILLPLAAKEKASVPRTRESIPSGEETILFVDDEKCILEISRLILERLGYTVETAETPRYALEIFGKDPERFDLVITDMTMPQMTGEALFEAVRKIREDIPVVVATGYSTLMDRKKAREIGMAAYIAKPIDRREMAKVVRDVLDDRKNFRDG